MISFCQEKFLYWPGLGCEWHENHTQTDKCCQAMLARSIYTVLDLCCPLYEVDMVPGKHQPLGPEPLKESDWEPLKVAKRYER